MQNKLISNKSSQSKAESQGEIKTKALQWLPNIIMDTPCQITITVYLLKCYVIAWNIFKKSYLDWWKN